MPTTTTFSLAGKLAVVTGASGALGARFARVLDHAGARVVLVGRDRGRLAEAASPLHDAATIVADLGVAEEREGLFREVGSLSPGGADILVNNAGTSNAVAIEDESLEDLAHLLEVNLVATWHLCKLFGGAMARAGSGAIVNVASTLGLVGGAPVKQAGYIASKGGVVSLSRELALQWARSGVRVNALCPGWFPSEMTAGMATPEGERYIGRHSPMPRMGRPEELDGPLLLLASDAGSFMTGSLLVVDGGWTAR